MSEYLEDSGDGRLEDAVANLVLTGVFYDKGLSLEGKIDFHRDQLENCWRLLKNRPEWANSSIRDLEGLVYYDDERFGVIVKDKLITYTDGWIYHMFNLIHLENMRIKNKYCES